MRHIVSHRQLEPAVTGSVAIGTGFVALGFGVVGEAFLIVGEKSAPYIQTETPKNSTCMGIGVTQVEMDNAGVTGGLIEEPGICDSEAQGVFGVFV